MVNMLDQEHTRHNTLDPITLNSVDSGQVTMLGQEHTVLHTLADTRDHFQHSLLDHT